MIFEDSDFNMVNKLLIVKCYPNSMKTIVEALLSNDYNIIVSTDDATGDYIIQCVLKNSDITPSWASKVNTEGVKE